MHPPHSPASLFQVADKFQTLAQSAKQERMQVVFQSVSAVSIAVMGLAASAHLLREVFGVGRGHGPGR
jgi:hypothetical protein